MQNSPDLSVQWVKNTNGEYLDLLRTDLKAPYFNTPHYGTYIIWYTAPNNAPVIRVGRGNIADEIQKMRSNPQILEFGKNGQLKVGWVEVGQGDAVRVEAYLYDKYKPLLGERPNINDDEPLSVLPL